MVSVEKHPVALIAYSYMHRPGAYQGNRSSGNVFAGGVHTLYAFSPSGLLKYSFDFPGGLDGLLRGVEISNRDICPGTRERERDLAADPARAARDEGSFAREREIVWTAQRFSSTGFGSAGQEIELP